MSDFLLELLSEEIPARMQAGARADFEKLFRNELSDAGVRVGEVTVWSTPRRLALIARNLPEITDDFHEEFKGPRVGAPPQALEGFLRKVGLTEDMLEERDGVWYAVIAHRGRPVRDLLAEAVAAIVRDFAWPKSMRWGDVSTSPSSLRWVRPLHSIVALLGEAIVPVAIDGVACSATTLGHRFHHPGPITIGGAHDYAQKLRACHVLVDQAEREAIIRKGAIEAAKKARFELVEDEGLVVENAGLTEWPVALLGSFDADYLDVPEEVIALTARINQKYFVMRDGAGKLAPHFVCIANIDANDGGAAIIVGNERVLAARLSDARFFWQQDVKVPLESQAKKLSAIVFHEKLGTVADKVERVAKLAEWLGKEGIVPNCDPKQARRAAQLCKADLVTGMVGEFPELQGVIGGYLARAQGEPAAVADAIRDHYKPVGQGDEVPSAPVTVAVSLADKLDSLGAFFFVREIPTGSKDPFALRRAALGAIRLMVENELRLPILKAADVTVDAFQNGWTRRSTRTTGGFARGLRNDPVLGKHDQQSYDLLDFFADRLKVQQREAGVRHDLIDAVFALGGEDDLVRLLARVKALQAFVETGEGANLLAGYKRAANILKKEEWDAGASGTGDVEPGEAELADALAVAEPQAAAAIDAERFGEAMSALASLRAPIDAFFDSVTVNASDAGVRARRLNLLARFRDAVHRVADFSKIEG